MSQSHLLMELYRLYKWYELNGYETMAEIFRKQAVELAQEIEGVRDAK